MLSYLKKKVRTFWEVGHERTLKIKKNIIYTVLIKGGNNLIGFLLVPLTVNYVDKSQYGIWLTVSAMVAWISQLDIGLSNGLRNKLAHLLALNEERDIVKYVSTTYAILTLFSSAVFIVFLLFGSFFNWNELLNADKAISYSIWPIILITLGSFCLQFILQPINSILVAIHEPFKSSLITLLGQLLTLILTFLLTRYTSASLLLLVIVIAGSPLFILLIANLYLFGKHLKKFVPSIKQVDFAIAKSLMNSSGGFFLIQIGGIVLYESDNIVITRILGPEYVTTFNFAFKYFFLLITMFTIVLNPYWSAFTDAYAKNDFSWIKHSVNKMRKIWLAVVVSAVGMYFFSNIFYRLWIGKKTVVPDLLSLSMMTYTILQTWMEIHAVMLNGLGKLKVQLYLVVSTGIINIPLSIFLIHRVGVTGTVWANCAMMLIINIFVTYQCKLIIDKKATGIWNS